MVEKKDGGSHMYSLNDFKIHNTINIENGYMEGRYGAIPFIGELICKMLILLWIYLNLHIQKNTQD